MLCGCLGQGELYEGGISVAIINDYRDKVVGLRPVYTNCGNNTEILLDTGEVLLDKRGLKAVLRSLAQSYAIDLNAQRKNLEQQLSKKGNLPFYLNPSRIFVPLKMRRALADHDMVYGYVDVRYLVIAAEKGKSCQAILSSGQVIEIFSNPDTANRCKDLGKALLDDLQKSADLDEEQAVATARFLIRTLKAIAAKS